jgi:hypothetical protein
LGQCKIAKTLLICTVVAPSKNSLFHFFPLPGETQRGFVAPSNSPGGGEPKLSEASNKNYKTDVVMGSPPKTFFLFSFPSGESPEGERGWELEGANPPEGEDFAVVRFFTGGAIFGSVSN